VSNVDQQRQHAIMLHSNGRLDEAADAYTKLLASHPNDAESLSLLGLLNGQRGNFDQAVSYLSKALALDTENIVNRVNLGRAYRGLGQITEALKEFDRALNTSPENADALFAKATTLLDQSNFVEAIEIYDTLLAVQPKHATAWLGRGNAQLSLGDAEAALVSYQKARQANPTIADHHLNEGQALLALGRFQQAREAFDRAVQIDPNLVNAHLGRASALMKLHNVVGALVSADKARKIQPNSANAYCLIGCGQFELGHFEKALEFLNFAIELQPSYPEALFAKGETLQRLGRHGEAAECFSSVIEIKPSMHMALGHLIAARLQNCDWTALGKLTSHLVELIDAGHPAAQPLMLQAVSDDAALMKRCAETITRRFHPRGTRNITRARFRKGGKIRIGYLSGQFSDAAFMGTLMPILQKHDRSQFELIGIDSGLDDGSAKRSELKAQFNDWLTVTDLSDMDASLRIAAMELDILVDLGGFASHARPNIFAQRPVAVQAGYLWLNTTSGSDYIDYLISDIASISDSARSNTTEKLVTLPNASLALPHSKAIESRAANRAAYALPEEALVFVYHGDAFKITPQVFSSWMQALKVNEKAVLWFTRSTETMSRNLSIAATNEGIAAERLIFAANEEAMVDPALWLADIALDSFPFGTQFNALEVIAAGVPILTIEGECTSSRRLASLLTSIGLRTLVASSASELATLITTIATSPSIRAEIKDQLKHSLSQLDEFNTQMVSSLERALRYIVELQESGRPPKETSIV
jgi:predicted O-linked N-acetylglucosamine transferase (SPINDLY family)